jgi:hypothetical protein
MSISRRILGVIVAGAFGAWATTLGGCGGADCLRNSDCDRAFECHLGACVPSAGSSAGKGGSAGSAGARAGSGGTSSAGHAGVGGSGGSAGGNAGHAGGGVSGTDNGFAGAP